MIRNVYKKLEKYRVQIADLYRFGIIINDSQVPMRCKLLWRYLSHLRQSLESAVDALS